MLHHCHYCHQSLYRYCSIANTISYRWQDCLYKPVPILLSLRVFSIDTHVGSEHYFLTHPPLTRSYVRTCAYFAHHCVPTITCRTAAAQKFDEFLLKWITRRRRRFNRLQTNLLCNVITSIASFYISYWSVYCCSSRRVGVFFRCHAMSLLLNAEWLR